MYKCIWINKIIETKIPKKMSKCVFTQMVRTYCLISDNFVYKMSAENFEQQILQKGTT